jgi:hypothetical protein
MASEADGFWRQPFRVVQLDLRKVDARELEPRRLVSQVVEYGGNVLAASAGGIMAWYPTRLRHQPTNEYLTRDCFGAILREAHLQGIRVWARVDLSKGSETLLAAHPDWFQITPKGEARREWGMALTCLHGPYWQVHAFDLVDEIMSRYPVDGFLVSRFSHGHCVCPACREAFLAYSGRELPLAEDWANVAWREYVRFRYEQMPLLAERLRGCIHERNPRAVLAVDLGLASDDPRHLCEGGWPSPRLAQSVDVVALGACGALQSTLPRHYLWAGEEARMGRALHRGLAACVTVAYWQAATSRRSAQPAAQLTHDLMQIAAHGAQPCVAFSGTFEQDDRKALGAVKQVYHHLRDNAASYEGLYSPARVALLYSQATMDFYGRGEPFERGLAEYRGWYEGLVESHVLFDVLHDDALDRDALGRYGLIILPNVASLTDEQGAQINAFVETGGHAIASYESGLYNVDGEPRRSPALRCLGRTPARRRKCRGSYLRIQDKGLLPGFGLTDVVPLDDVLVATLPVDPSGDQVTDLCLIPPVANHTPEFAFWEEETDTPGLVISPFGRGEAAYLPWQIGKLYHLAGAPEYRQLMVDLVERVVPPMATTDAPSSVELTLHYVRADSRHAIVHLLNATGRQGKPLTEVVPVHAISVWVRGEYTRAGELRNGEELALSHESGGVRFTLGRLDAFAAIELLADRPG